MTASAAVSLAALVSALADIAEVGTASDRSEFPVISNLSSEPHVRPEAANDNVARRETGAASAQEADADADGSVDAREG